MVDLNEYSVHSYAPIERLLCEECEQRFSKWENPAKGFGDKSDIGGKYGPWLLKFATSISWRALKYQLMRPQWELGEDFREILQCQGVGEALDCWAMFLLRDKFTAASKRHRQHLFLVSPDYIMRPAIGLTLGAVDGHVFTYTRFSFYCILGLIESNCPKELETSHIKANGGDTPGVNYMTRTMAEYLIGVEQEALARAIAYATRDNPKFIAEMERRGQQQ